MGLIDNVNVNVGGNGNIIDTLSTYVTKLLKPNIVDGKNVLTQEMMSAANTKYVIKYDYTLGEDITVPENCVLDFEGGSIKNGHICFNDTRVIHAKFINCTYDKDSRMVVDYIDDIVFGHNSSEDPADYLEFLFQNTFYNNCCCHIYNSYTSEFAGYTSFTSPGFAENYKGECSFDFHGNTIKNTRIFEVEGGEIGLFLLINSNNITVSNLIFIDEANTLTTWNTHTGFDIVQCLGDCDNINVIDCTLYNGCNVVGAGMFMPVNDHQSWFQAKGLTNSKIKAKAINASYGSHFHGGANLDIDINQTNCGRGLYLGGVSNANINYWGQSVSRTDSHVLLKDALYKESEGVFRTRGCNNINLSITIPYLEANIYPLVLAAYDSDDGISPYTFGELRTDKASHSNISAVYNIQEMNLPFTGLSLLTEDSSEYSNWGCDFNNVTIFNAVPKESKNTSLDNTFYLSRYTGRNSNISLNFVNCINEDANVNLPEIKIFLHNLVKGTISLVNTNVDKIKLYEKSNGVVAINQINSNCELVEGDSESDFELIRFNIISLYNKSLFGTVSQAPTLSWFHRGATYYAKDIQEIIYWNGTKWCNSEGMTPAARRGSSSERPQNLSTTDKGFSYYDTTINEEIYWTGTEWVDYLVMSPFIHSGETTARPTSNMKSWHKGFYFYDKTIQKPIWWNGSAWVDATGATV